MLHQIVKIKTFRVEAAEREVIKAKAALMSQQKALNEHREAVEAFRQFILTEKHRLFKKIENIAIGLKAINEYKDDVVALKEELLAREKKTSDLEDQLIQAEQRVEQAQVRYRKCYVDLQKYEEVTQEIGENEQRLELAKEEAEQEDLVASKILSVSYGS